MKKINNTVTAVFAVAAMYLSLAAFNGTAEARVCFLPNGGCNDVSPQSGGGSGQMCSGYTLTQEKGAGTYCSIGWDCQSCTHANGHKYYKCTELSTPAGYTPGLYKCGISCQRYSYSGCTGSELNGMCSELEGYTTEKPGHCTKYETPEYVYGVEVSDTSVTELSRSDCYYNIVPLGDGYTTDKYDTTVFDVETEYGSDGVACNRIRGCNRKNGWYEYSDVDGGVFVYAEKSEGGYTCRKVTGCKDGYSESAEAGYKCTSSTFGGYTCYDCSEPEQCPDGSSTVCSRYGYTCSETESYSGGKPCCSCTSNSCETGGYKTEKFERYCENGYAKSAVETEYGGQTCYDTYSEYCTYGCEDGSCLPEPENGDCELTCNGSACLTLNEDTCACENRCSDNETCDNGECVSACEITCNASECMTVNSDTCTCESKCSDGQECVNGECGKNCVSDSDCGSNETCCGGECKDNTPKGEKPETERVCENQVYQSAGEYAMERRTVTWDVCKQEYITGEWDDRECCLARCDYEDTMCEADADNARNNEHDCTEQYNDCVAACNGDESCPAGYSTGVTNCNGKSHPEGWNFETSGSVNGSPCGRCTPKQCPQGQVTDVRDCARETGYSGNGDPQYRLSATGDYSGDEQCMSCTCIGQCDYVEDNDAAGCTPSHNCDCDGLDYSKVAACKWNYNNGRGCDWWRSVPATCGNKTWYCEMCNG